MTYKHDPFQRITSIKPLLDPLFTTNTTLSSFVEVSTPPPDPPPEPPVPPIEPTEPDRYTKAVYSVHFNPAGTLLAVGHESDLANNDPSTVTLYSVSGTTLTKLASYRPRVVDQWGNTRDGRCHAVRFSPNGQYLVCDGTVNWIPPSGGNSGFDSATTLFTVSGNNLSLALNYRNEQTNTLDQIRWFSDSAFTRIEDVPPMEFWTGDPNYLLKKRGDFATYTVTNTRIPAYNTSIGPGFANSVAANSTGTKIAAGYYTDQQPTVTPAIIYNRDTYSSIDKTFSYTFPAGARQVAGIRNLRWTPDNNYIIASQEYETLGGLIVFNNNLSIVNQYGGNATNQYGPVNCTSLTMNSTANKIAVMHVGWTSNTPTSVSDASYGLSLFSRSGGTLTYLPSNGLPTRANSNFPRRTMDMSQDGTKLAVGGTGVISAFPGRSYSNLIIFQI